MAIAKSTKIVLVIATVLIIAGIGAYIIKKRKKVKVEEPKIEPKKVEEILADVFDNLNFNIGKAEIKKESLPYLDKLADTLIKAKNWTLDIEGHTDNVGTDEYNIKLSQNRADAVKNYLVSKGVLDETITAKGFGEKNPLTDNNSQINKEKNRRVEFKIKKPNNEIITTII